MGDRMSQQQRLAKIGQAFVVSQSAPLLNMGENEVLKPDSSRVYLLITNASGTVLNWRISPAVLGGAYSRGNMSGGGIEFSLEVHKGLVQQGIVINVDASVGQLTITTVNYTGVAT